MFSARTGRSQARGNSVWKLSVASSNGARAKKASGCSNRQKGGKMKIEKKKSKRHCCSMLELSPLNSSARHLQLTPMARTAAPKQFSMSPWQRIPSVSWRSTKLFTKGPKNALAAAPSVVKVVAKI